MKTDEPQISLARSFQCSAATLWQALSDRKQMVVWYFDSIPDFEATIGFNVRFPVSVEERIFTHCWEVTEALPGKRLSYRWCYEEYPGEAIIHFELSGDAPTRLEVTMDVLEDFPDEIPEFEHSNCVAGWEYFIGESLTRYIESVS